MSPTFGKCEPRHTCKTRGMFSCAFKEMDFTSTRHSSTQSFLISRTSCLRAVFSVCLTFSSWHKVILSVQRCQKERWLWKKQRKRRELNPNEQSGGLSILMSPASRREDCKLGYYRQYHIRTQKISSKKDSPALSKPICVSSPSSFLPLCFDWHRLQKWMNISHLPV